MFFHVHVPALRKWALLEPLFGQFEGLEPAVHLALGVTAKTGGVSTNDSAKVLRIPSAPMISDSVHAHPGGSKVLTSFQISGLQYH
jgi:hypothetical protein